MDFEDALADQECLRTIRAIEDLWRSLDDGSKRDAALEAELAAAVTDLRRQRGVIYDPRIIAGVVL